MHDVKKFFSENRQYESKCEMKHFISESSNCKDIADRFISHSYDILAGSITIRTNTETLPNGIDNDSIVYNAFINNKEALNSDINVSDGELTLTMQDADSVYSDGTSYYGNSPYNIIIVASIADKSTGCVFNHAIDKMSKNRFEIKKDGDIYSIVYVPINDEVFDIDSGTYKWRINGKVLDNTGTSINLSNKNLINYTDDDKAVCSVELVGSDIHLKTDPINIIRNEYLIQTTYSPVINGNDFYVNFNTRHNAGNVKVNYYINNILLNESHALWNQVKTKELTTVLTLNSMPVENVFDSSNLDSFIAYFRQEVRSSIDFNFNPKIMLNKVSENTVFSSEFARRRIVLDKNDSRNYIGFIGNEPEQMETIDENPSIMEIIDGTWHDKKRIGLIYRDNLSDGEIGHNVITNEFASKVVTHNSIVRKEDIYVNDEPTTLYRTVSDLKIDFTGNFDTLVDDESIGITTASNELESEIEFKVNDNERIIVVDFTTGYVKRGGAIGSGISIDFYTDENEKISSFGLEKISEEEYLIKADNGLLYHKFQPSYNKSFHIRTGSRKISKYIRVKFKNCREEDIGIRDMVITTRKVLV